MKTPQVPLNEPERLRTLHSLNILDTESEERFDRITRIAKRMFNVPIELISLVDENRQWFKSCLGLAVGETSRDISFCGHAILENNCFIIEDASKDERFHDNPLVVGEPYIKFYAGCPIQYSDDSNLGTLCIIDSKPRHFTKEDHDALIDLAKTVENEIVSFDLATIDSLTKLNNRRGFEFIASKELDICSRYFISASLVYIDLNGFKPINDTYGHAEGDKALSIFGKQVANISRKSDIPARLGGDEFVILFVNTNKEAARKAMQRLRNSLDEILKNEEKPYSLNYSYGIVEYHTKKHDSIDALLSAADSEMYKHKHN